MDISFNGPAVKVQYTFADFERSGTGKTDDPSALCICDLQHAIHLNANAVSAGNGYRVPVEVKACRIAVDGPIPHGHIRGQAVNSATCWQSGRIDPVLRHHPSRHPRQNQQHHHDHPYFPYVHFHLHHPLSPCVIFSVHYPYL